jgi:hypothetical protein
MSAWRQIHSSQNTTHCAVQFHSLPTHLYLFFFRSNESFLWRQFVSRCDRRAAHFETHSRQKTGSLAVRSVNRASCRGSWHGGWKDKGSNTLKWRADPSAVGWMVPDVATLFGLLDPEDDGPRVLRKVYSHWPKITMSHTRRLESSAKSLRLACTWHLSVAPLCLVDDTVFCCKEQRIRRSTMRLISLSINYEECP